MKLFWNLGEKLLALSESHFNLQFHWNKISSLSCLTSKSNPSLSLIPWKLFLSLLTRFHIHQQIHFLDVYRKMEHFIYNLPLMDLMWSKKMNFIQLIIPVESAQRVVSYLGEVSFLQFRDISSLPYPIWLFLILSFLLFSSHFVFFL